MCVRCEALQDPTFSEFEKYEFHVVQVLFLRFDFSAGSVQIAYAKTHK